MAVKFWIVQIQFLNLMMLLVWRPVVTKVREQIRNIGLRDQKERRNLGDAAI